MITRSSNAVIEGDFSPEAGSAGSHEQNGN
jgi:hypothetical protein